MSRPIYLDHQATTPVDPAVVEAMLPYFSERFGNPSGRAHVFGQEAHAAVEAARAQVGALIGAEPDEIVFTSGATESNNLALRGGARSMAARGRHVVVSAIEHASVLEPTRSLEREGFAVTPIPVSGDGVVALADVAAALRPDTTIVSVMAANNEIGTVQPIEAVAALCRERGIVFHTDAVQAAASLPLDGLAAGIDAISLSAHKMYGPKGIGALFLSRRHKPRFRPQPQAEGGGQERGVRSGTLNVPAIVGFGKAAELARLAIAGGEPARIGALRDRLLARLRESIDGLEVNGAMAPRLPGNLNVSIERAHAETLILALAGRVGLSSGAACAEAEGKGSHVLRALGLSDSRVYTALRFGLGRYNSGSDIDRVVELLAVAVQSARARASGGR